MLQSELQFITDFNNGYAFLPTSGRGLTLIGLAGMMYTESTSSLVSTLFSTLGLARRASFGAVMLDRAIVLSGGGPFRG